MEDNKNKQLEIVQDEIINLEKIVSDLFRKISEINCSINNLQKISESLQPTEFPISIELNKNNTSVIDSKKQDEMAREITKEEKKIIQLKNGQVNVPFEEIIELKKFDISNDLDIEFDGIEGLKWNNEARCFKGNFPNAGEYSGILSFYLNKDDKENKKPKIERKVDILVNSDPKDLWKDIDPPSDGIFYKDNTDFKIEKVGNRRLLGVSSRGKSHANKGTFRDDDFEIDAWEEKGWVLQVVSDGAGSAEFSREGSKIACKTVLNEVASFIDGDKFEIFEALLIDVNGTSTNKNNKDTVNSEEGSSLKENIVEDKSTSIIIDEEVTISDSLNEDDILEPERNSISLNKLDGSLETAKEDVETVNSSNTVDISEEAKVKNELSDLIVELTVHPAFKVQKDIKDFAEANNIPIKKFSSTLLFALSKEFDFGTVIVSFSVGDGAIGVISEKGGTLLMEPDGGEFSGQTRFITMNEIFQDGNVYTRAKLNVFSEKVDAIILMSDGISDPKFGTDNNLKDSNIWIDLWKELQPVIVDNEPTEKSLLDWINFHEKGEYDDRTLTVLY